MTAPTNPTARNGSPVHPGNPGHAVQPRHAVGGASADGAHPTSAHPTSSYPAVPPAGADPTIHADAPTGRSPQAPAIPGATEPRTIRVRLAAVIAVVAFLIGLGVSMLLGPIMGGPPNGGGPGGPGGQTGTSTSQTSQTGQQGTGT